jgi:hypothetical protein
MGAFNHIRHRCVRVWQSYFPEPLSEDEHRTVKEFLDDDLRSLFYEQPLCDQRHGLLVFEKAKSLFAGDSPAEKELFIASCFHDVAKKDCHFGATRRIIAALVMSVVPQKRHAQMLDSRVRFIRRIGIYASHSSLSWELIAPYTKSEFVRLATCDHHRELNRENLSSDMIESIDLFIEADTL